MHDYDKEYKSLETELRGKHDPEEFHNPNEYDIILETSGNARSILGKQLVTDEGQPDILTFMLRQNDADKYIEMLLKKEVDGVYLQWVREGKKYDGYVTSWNFQTFADGKYILFTYSVNFIKEAK